MVITISIHFDCCECIDGNNNFNFHFQIMKDALDAAGLKVHLMVQPLAYITPDAKKQGFIDLPEFPFGKEHFYCDQEKDIQI